MIKNGVEKYAVFKGIKEIPPELMAELRSKTPFLKMERAANEGRIIEVHGHSPRLPRPSKHLALPKTRNKGRGMELCFGVFRRRDYGSRGILQRQRSKRDGGIEASGFTLLGCAPLNPTYEADHTRQNYSSKWF